MRRRNDPYRPGVACHHDEAQVIVKPSERPVPRKSTVLTTEDYVVKRSVRGVGFSRDCSKQPHVQHVSVPVAMAGETTSGMSMLVTPHGNTLLQFYYDSEERWSFSSVSECDDLPKVKIGGVWHEVSSRAIANIVYLVAGVKVMAVESIPYRGVCALTCATVADGETVISKLTDRVWMAPHCAYFAFNDSAAAELRLHVSALHQDDRPLSIPRHLVSVKVWLTAGPARRGSECANES